MAHLPSLLQLSSPPNNSENEWNLSLCIWCRNLNLFCFSVYVLSYFFVLIWSFSSYMQLAVPLYSISFSLSSSHYSPPSYVSAMQHLKSKYDKYSWYLQMLFSFCGTLLSSLHLAKPWLDLKSHLLQGLSPHLSDEVKSICWMLSHPLCLLFVILNAFVMTRLIPH